MLIPFTLKLAAGMALMLCLMPRRDVTSGFFRVQMLTIMGLCVLLTLSSPDYWLIGGGLAAVAFVGSVLWILERRVPATALLFVLGAGLGGALARLPWLNSAWTPYAPWHLAADFSSAGTLGGMLTAMLLGHRYLTSPGMPLRPLVALNGALAAAAILRLAISSASLGMFHDALQSPSAWLFLTLRWLAGIGGPLLVPLLVWNILKYRNTQSATGVLFAGVVLALLGELSSDLLREMTARPY